MIIPPKTEKEASKVRVLSPDPPTCFLDYEKGYLERLRDCGVNMWCPTCKAKKYD